MKYQLIILYVFFTLTLHANTIFVNNSANGNNDGTSWQNAYLDLQDAINVAVDGDDLWIAQGVYYPTNGTNRYLHFELKNGVKWYGGFNGTEVSLLERDPVNNISLLSGDIGLTNDSTDNSFTVVYTEFTDSTTVLDGLAIDHGNANSDNVNDGFGSPAKCGGGIYILGNGSGNEARPIINNCTFYSNSAAVYGGAIFLSSGSGGSVSSSIHGCFFFNNKASLGGGAISKVGGNNGTHIISTSAFIANEGLYGGAIHYHDTHGEGTFTIDSCSFDGNFANRGGALDIEDSNNLSKIKILSSNFSNSKTLSEGVAIYLLTSDSTNDLEIIGCDFIENRDSFGLGIFALVGFGLPDENIKEILFLNSTFKNNFTGSRGLISLETIFQLIELKLINSILIENEVAGNCIYMDTYGSKCVVKNSLIYNNENKFDDSNIFQMPTTSINNIGTDTTLIVENSILWGNISGVNEKYVDGRGNFSFKNCLIDLPSCQSITKDTLGNATCFNMLYNQYPDFVDTTNCDFRLKPCSPAVNAGDNNLVDSAMVFDFLANPRISEDIVDIGPYEAEFPLSISTIDSVLCYGDTTGVVLFDFEDGVFPLNYQWENAQETGIINTGLASGDYLFTVTDAAGCSRTIDLEISQSDDLQISSSIVDASGSAQSDGEIQLTSILGGTLPYNYIWSNGDNTQSINDLLPGTYDLTITDGNNCEYLFTFDVDFTIAVSQIVGTGNIWSYPGIVKPEDTFSFYIDSPEDAKIELIMFNTLGEKVYQESLDKKEKELIKTMEAPNHSGLYFINVLVNGDQRKVLYLLVNQ